MEQDKLGIKPEFFDQLVSCDWFCNCGDKTFDQFEVYIEEDREMAIARLKSLVRENACLDRRNAICSAVRKIPADWSNAINEVQRSGCLGKVSRRVKSEAKKKGISEEEVLEIVRSDVWHLFMANYFSAYYNDVFYEQMLQIYLSGHLPCGYEWKKFRVY